MGCMQEKLVDVSWSHTLERKDDKLILTVLCGTVGLFDVAIELTTAEKEQYALNGKEYIESLAKTIHFRGKREKSIILTK